VVRGPKRGAGKAGMLTNLQPIGVEKSKGRGVIEEGDKGKKRAWGKT